MVTEVKSQMRREEMWRERWARIIVPDRALTIGTLRYAHVCKPCAEVLNADAQDTVGRLHYSSNRLRLVSNVAKASVRMMNLGASDTSSSSSVAATQRPLDVKIQADQHGSNAKIGEAWAEIVDAFFEHYKDIAKLFDQFKTAYLSERDPNYSTTWQPLASRLASLEEQVARLHATVDDGPSHPTVAASSTAQATDAAGISCTPLVISPPPGEHNRPRIKHERYCVATDLCALQCQAQPNIRTCLA